MVLPTLLAILFGDPTGEVPVQRPSDHESWALEWTAPEGCPDRAAMLDRLAAHLPGAAAPADGPGRVDLRIRVEIEASGDRYVARLETSGQDGNDARSFSAASCEDLADAGALIIAVALDPVLAAATVRERTTAPEPAPTPTSVPVEDTSAAVVEPAEADAREEDPKDPKDEENEGRVRRPRGQDDDDGEAPSRDFVIGVGLSGTVSWGPITEAVGGLLGTFSLTSREGPWRWQLEGGWWAPRTLRFIDDRGGRVQGWHVGTRGCYVLRGATTRVAPPELPLCLGFEAGQVSAEGLPPTTNIQRQRLPWVAPTVSAGLRWPFLPWLALAMDLSVSMPLFRGRFTIGDTQLTAIAPVPVGGVLGLEARF